MPETFQEFHDPRLVPLYDAWNPGREDAEFYLALAKELDPDSILDIGCGTGIISVELARAGFAVTGVDPAARMIEVARTRDGGDLVRWIEGDAGHLDDASGDLAIMTAHVPQVIFDQDAWARTLREAYRALRPGGRLAFESRNPEAREWERWTPEHSRRRLDPTPLGPVESWINLLEVIGDLVTYDIRYRIEATGEEVISHGVLRFRSSRRSRPVSMPRGSPWTASTATGTGAPSRRAVLSSS